MRIQVLGGGPAGLYFALLMKKRDRALQVTVHERNGPDDTFGWGVVFSDKTMSYLRDYDEETHAAILGCFENWDNVDVVHRGRKISIHGNRFAGVARIELLHLLQRRCAQLGVELRFHSNVADPRDLRDCDLLVGADGVNSVVRQTWAEHFRPTIGKARNKYIWFGTDRIFDGMTLTFRPTDAGVFMAHSYKFCKTRSTFIVECNDDTWARAGLDRKSDEETRAWLERDVFAADLKGQKLLSNNSRWINFVLVKNDRWRHENVVLLGDALHTAHFSIGSGTKLAMEDAIALYESFAGGIPVTEALTEFESVRKPIVDRTQAMAVDSLAFFENARDHIHLEPLEFAYRLMTRSGRIDHENLRRRDPEFVAAYERSKSS